MSSRNYIRKGKFIQTRPRRDDDSAIIPYHKKKIKTTDGGYAFKAVAAAKREDILERGAKPYTKEEWDAIRREEERLAREEIAMLRKQHEELTRQDREYHRKSLRSASSL